MFAASARADDPEAMVKWGKAYEAKVLPIVQAKCLSCHSGESPDGEFDLSKFPDGPSAVANPDAWERVAKRVRLNEMPPQGSPGLNDPEKAAFHRWVDARPNQDLCHQLASEETQSWYRGYVMSRRLSRYEYGCAIRDLTGFHVPEDMLPPSDGAGGMGFDTAGDALFTSPIHLEAYLRIGQAAVAHLLDPSNAQALPARLVALGFRDPPAALAQPTDATATPLHTVARTWIAQFARRAWRRPIQEQEVDRLMQLFDRNASSPLHEALRLPMHAVLISPNFLVTAEPEAESAGVHRLSAHAFATRFALLIWSSIPDEELLACADAGTIFEPDVIRQQLHRLLRDERARALGENWGLQWLGLRDWRQWRPDPEVFPEYDPELAADAIEETVRAISDVFRQQRPLLELLDSQHVTVNARLAKHYALPWPEIDSAQETTASATLPSWRTLPVPSGERGGILTMASVLLKASYPRRTSPVLRGRWILEEVLGAKVPPPPPNVPALEESGHESTATSLRERLELHRKNPECAACHQRMDPLGFGLENYDAIGRWRNKDGGVAIDASGTLPSGESFRGPAELKRILVARQDEFQLHAIRKLVGFALGRELNKFDQCVIDASMKRLREERSADVILEEILMSYPFQHRYTSPKQASP